MSEGREEGVGNPTIAEHKEHFNGDDAILFWCPNTFYYYYTHKPYDSSTGLYYYGARYYDPEINRFITEDQMKYSKLQNPLTLNRYDYVVNNPETLNDPSGHVYVTSSPHGDLTTTSISSHNSKMTFDEYLTFVWLTNPSNLEQIGIGLLSILTILAGPTTLFLVSAIAGGNMDAAAVVLAGMLASEQLIPDLTQTIEGAASGNAVKSSEGIFNLVSDSYSFLVNQLSWETKLEFFASFGTYEGVTAFLTAGTWQAGSVELAADTATGLVMTWYSEAQIDYELYLFSS